MSRNLGDIITVIIYNLYLRNELKTYTLRELLALLRDIQYVPPELIYQKWQNLCVIMSTYYPSDAFSRALINDPDFSQIIIDNYKKHPLYISLAKNIRMNSSQLNHLCVDYQAVD